jgi:hypothetical protein
MEMEHADGQPLISNTLSFYAHYTKTAYKRTYKSDSMLY